MNPDLPFDLKPRSTPGARIYGTDENTWRLEIPAGTAGSYRLAQLDDYGHLPRRSFPWRPDTLFKIRGRASHPEIPGTWGFGLWNDPFSMAFRQGGGLRLPALPNAAWFFFSSTQSYLSLAEPLPGNKATACTFRSPTIPAGLLSLGIPGLPLLAWPPSARMLRKMVRTFVHQDAVQLSLDSTAWHDYTITWRSEGALLGIDGQEVLRTRLSPNGKLGLVVWVDNQYAAFPPSGKLGYGTLAANSECWIEVSSLEISILSGA